MIRVLTLILASLYCRLSHSVPCEIVGTQKKNAELWAPRRDGSRVILSRIGSIVEKSSVTYLSLSELVTSSGSAGLQYRINNVLKLKTLDGSGEATANLKSGEVTRATGTLAGLAGQRMTPIKRTEGDRPFLTLDGLDFLLNIEWVRPLFGKASARNDYLLPLYPKVPDLEAANVLTADGDWPTFTFSEVFLHDGELKIGIKARIQGARRPDRTIQYALYYSSSFENTGLRPLLVQPALLRPLASGILSSEGPHLWPLGIQNTAVGGYGGFIASYKGFRPAATPELAPSRILASGQKGTFGEIRIPITMQGRPRYAPLCLNYQDGSRNLGLEVFPRFSE